MGARVRTALTIAGSDSGGGAGIQADLKSFASVGVHGTSVITCVTAQNTRSVDSIFAIPPAEIRKQLRAVLDDFDVRAAKTGMLFSAAIVRTVARELRRTSFPLVVDPVMIATVADPPSNSTARAARSRPRPPRTWPSDSRFSPRSGAPAGRWPLASGPRTGPAAGSILSIPKSDWVARTPSAGGERHCTFLAHYQSALALPKTSSRLIKIGASAWSGHPRRRARRTPCVRPVRPRGSDGSDDRGDRAQIESQDRPGGHEAREPNAEALMPCGSHSSRTAICRRSTAS